MLNQDADGFQNLQRVFDSIVLSVEDRFDVSQVDEPFGALNAGKVSDENIFLDMPRGIAVNDGVFFRMKASTVAGLLAIASVVESGSVAVVSDSENFSKIRARDDGTDSESMAG